MCDSDQQDKILSACYSKWSMNHTGCYDRGGFPGDTLDRVRKYGVNAQELVTTSSTRLLMTT